MNDPAYNAGQEFNDVIAIEVIQDDALVPVSTRRKTYQKRCICVVKIVARLLTVALGCSLILLGLIAQGLAKGESPSAAILGFASGIYIVMGGLFGKWSLLFTGFFIIFAAFGLERSHIVLPMLMMAAMVLSPVYSFCWCCGPASTPPLANPRQLGEGIIHDIEMDQLHQKEPQRLRYSDTG